MAGDKDIQTQDQAYQVQGYCAVVDDNMGNWCCGIGVLLSNHIHFIPVSTIISRTIFGWFNSKTIGQNH